MNNQMTYYKQSSDALFQAREMQTLIQNKDLQIELCQINQRYNQGTLTDALTYQNLLLERSNLIVRRDASLSLALDLALILVQNDISNDVAGIWSTGNMALKNIMSFVDMNRIGYSFVSFSTRMKLKQIAATLVTKGYDFFDLRYNIEKISNF